MALPAPRYSESRLPSPKPARGHSWLPSIASLAFTAAIGLVLLLQSFAIEPGRTSLVSPANALTDSANKTADPLPIGAPVVLQQAVLSEQNANHSASLGALLLEASSGETGYASLSPPTFATRTGESLQATQASPVPSVASSLASVVTPTPEPKAAGITGCESHGPLYCVHEVQPGQTLASIAKLAGLQSTEDVAAHDLLVIERTGRLHRVPAVRAFVREVDLSGRRIVIEEIDGLWE